MTPRPLVFVSAASSDLSSARKIVNESLLKIECSPVEKSLSGTEYGRIPDLLRRWIAPCQAVIHLVGRDYGGEPDPTSLPTGQRRRSWTQYEYDYAIEQNKKLYVIVCDESFPHDDAAPQPDDKRELQQAYREAVLNDGFLWNRVTSEEELENAVLRMKLPLDEVRAELRTRQLRQRWTAGVTSVAVVLLLGGVINGLGQVERKVDQAGERIAQVAEESEQTRQNTEQVKGDTSETKETTAEIKQKTKRAREHYERAERVRQHIRDKSEVDVKAARERHAKWDEVRELERRSKLALNKADDLIRTIQQGLQGEPDAVFREASRILTDEGVDAAIDYLASHEDDIEQRVDDLVAEKQLLTEPAEETEQKIRRILEPLLLKADLHETNIEYGEARKLYETVAGKAPEWSRVRRELGSLFRELADFQLAEPHLVAAIELAESDNQRAAAANALGMLYLDQARYAEAEPLLTQFLKLVEQLHGKDHPETATALNNLAWLLRTTNRLAKAEPLMHRVLTIKEQAYGPEHPNVATALNNLSLLLEATNRMAKAEPLIRRALTIKEQSYGAEHPGVAISLNNLAQLLQGTNRMAEAEPLMRRALTIDEQSYGAEHHRVATDLSNLARLLQAINRMAEAEPLYRRALAIDEQSYGAEHPKVAIRLNNLASLLKSTHRLAEAEPLNRRALNIDEQSYGTEHPNVARRLNNLALLLQATNRLAAAEPLIRRALAIDERSYGAEHPNVARDLNNLAQLLHATNRLAEAEPLSRRMVEIFALFTRATGHEHPKFRVAIRNYTGILQARETPPDEIEQRVQTIAAAKGPFSSILPEVERLLGPATSVDDVLADLDEQYRAEDRPAVYFLEPDQPLTPHLESLLAPTRAALAEQGLQAYVDDRNADAVVLLDAAIKRNGDWLLTIRTYRGAALRDLGALEQAREELTETASAMRQSEDMSAVLLGR